MNEWRAAIGDAKAALNRRVMETNPQDDWTAYLGDTSTGLEAVMARLIVAADDLRQRPPGNLYDEHSCLQEKVILQRTALRGTTEGARAMVKELKQIQRTVPRLRQDRDQWRRRLEDAAARCVCGAFEEERTK